MDQPTLSERVERIEHFLGDKLDTATEREFTRRATIYAGPNTGFRLRDQDENAEPDFKASKTSPKLADQTAFEEIIQRISSCNDRVCLTADKLQKIGDRIMGELPQNTEETVAGGQRSPDGTLEHTFMALNWLDASLSRLEQVALRMERV